MTTVDLACVPADVSATALGLLLDGPLPELLADTVIDAGPHGHLHLAVIGGSHVVTVHGDGLRFREEISCTAAGARHPLPERADRPGYRLETRTERLDPAEFTRRADALVDAADDWFVVRFPGPGRHHLTALHGRRLPDGWAWRTRHLYPEENTIVSTRSTYRP